MIREKDIFVGICLAVLAFQSIQSAATNEPAYQNDLDSQPSYQIKENPEAYSKRSLSSECENGYSTTCLKLDIISFIEKMSDTTDFSLLPGLSVVKEAEPNKTKTAEVVAELARSFPNDPEKRLDNFLLYKLNSYLDSHALRLRLIDEGAAEKLGEARKGGGFGGGGGGKKGGYGGLIAAAMMMKGTLGALAMGALAMLAGKALMTALMSLMLSAIIGLKSLASGGHKSTTYEIVTKPVYSHSQSHSSSHEDVHGGGGYGHSGYGRSLNLELPKHLRN